MGSTKTNRPHYQGFSLIEVLVALLVLSLGLLGLAALQTTALQFNTDSYLRTQATYFVYDIVDQMRTNSSAAVNGGTYDVPDSTAANTIIGNYNNCKASTCACDSTNCNVANLATYDLGKWYERIRATLPETTQDAYLPTIDIDSANQVTVTMRWKDRDLPSAKELKWVIQL